MACRRRLGGIARVARDVTVRAVPVGWNRPARLADGITAVTGQAIVIYPDYRPGFAPSDTFKRIRQLAYGLDVTLERIGQDDHDGPADAYRAIGPWQELAELIKCRFIRSAHLDAPCSVSQIAVGSGAEKVRPSGKPPKPKKHSPAVLLDADRTPTERIPVPPITSRPCWLPADPMKY